MTYTYAILEISRQAFDEIEEKLRVAGYADQFHYDKHEHHLVIDMHGIALATKEEAVLDSGQ